VIEELETMTANIMVAKGKVSDAEIAAQKLPPSEAVDNLRDSIDSCLVEIGWVLEYIKMVAKAAQP